MTLKDWLQTSQMTQEQFEQISGVGQSSISRVRAGGICSPTIALKIHEATEGAVTPNDIYLTKAA